MSMVFSSSKQKMAQPIYRLPQRVLHCLHPDMLPKSSPPWSSGNNKFPRDSLIRQISLYFWGSAYHLYFLAGTSKCFCIVRNQESMAVHTCQQTNRLKAKGKLSAFKIQVNSRCTARVDAQVKRHTYILLNSSALFELLTYNGAAKSRPMWANGGSSDT